MQKMTPQQALAVLDQVAAQFKGNRADHLKIQEALSIISGAIEIKKVEQKDENEEG